MFYLKVLLQAPGLDREEIASFLEEARLKPERQILGSYRTEKGLRRDAHWAVYLSEAVGSLGKGAL